MRLAVVADDLTGAMDTGVQFAKCGLQTAVMLTEGELAVGEVVVVSTDSRSVTAAEAYHRTTVLGPQLTDRLVYKKIDSTMRGNIGPEIEGLLDSMGLERALVTPSFLAAGRTVVNGFHRVHGVLLAESSFARDPLWPATESHVPTMLARQSKRAVGHLAVSVVEEGSQAVMRALAAEPAPIVAADAASASHLQTLASALVELKDTWLPCGSAGLAQEWRAALKLVASEGVPFRWPELARPVLVVAGSRNPTTQKQLRQAAETCELNLVALFGPTAKERDERQAQVLKLLDQGSNAALTTSFSAYEPGEDIRMAEALADATVLILQKSSVAGLIITGGDTARATCGALGATAVQLVGEVQAGVPAGTLVSGPHDGLRVVTKAGGFGDELVVVQGIRFLRGEWR